jgi:hypothetical protein
MRPHSRLFRLTASTAIVGLMLGPLLPQAGFAQSAPPPLAPPSAAPDQAPQTTADPPTRVGRLSRVAGQVSFHGIGADHWDTTTLNFPVTSGDSFWTQPGASADLGITNNRVTMDQSTELDVTTLDDRSFVATIPQGQIYLRLLALQPGETFTVTTPRGTVAITASGRYEIAAGDTENPTRLTVVQGAAQISGSNVNLQVAANQTALITGTDPFQTQVVPAQRDAFLTTQLARERPPPVAGGITAPAEVVQMTGGEDLAEYGTWQQAPQYGAVWYPQVAAGYVPYRNGHWAYVAPWGWTWIDAAPWGFAPFHYGRWVQIDGRWGWTPGGGGIAYGAPGYVAPIYAPALVTFFGIGVGVGVAVGVGLAGGFGGNVGWCPLGWQEPYRPWYRASPTYVRNVNTTYVRNVTNITTINNNSVTINNFANRAGATMVPASAMALSRPVSQLARPVPAAQFADARPVLGREPIAPNAATAGVTPRLAQEMHLAAPPAGAAVRLQAPGPAIRAQVAVPNARPPLEANGHSAGAGAPAIAEHAPGPPIEPHGATPGAGGAPALRAPAEAAHPEQAARPEPVVRPEQVGRQQEAARPEARPPVAANPSTSRANATEARPQPQAHEQPRHPASQAHAAPASHPQPQFRAPPEPHPQAHAAPAPHAQPHPAGREPERQGQAGHPPHRG